MEDNLDRIKEVYPEYIPDKSPKNFVNRTGLRYGRLTVLYRTYNNKHNEARWVCKCDCGNFGVFHSNCLATGNTQSCGCLHKELASLAKHKINKYDLSGDYGVGYTSNTNEKFYFDLEDYDKIKDYCWYKNDQGYILTSKNENQHVRMHRIIMNAQQNEIIDHVNQCRNDNRKENLRFANKQTNSINRGCNSNNKLGIKGVNKCSNCDKYTAKIMYNGKTIYLGIFDTIEEAKAARISKEIELFGEFAYVE